jgi:RNA polymerase sigma-54 factor
MRELLASEPAGKPLSDMRLAQMLADRNVVIARRTVAKYREAMGVPPAGVRKARGPAGA